MTIRATLAAAVLIVLSGCRTLPQLPPVDLSQPGWQVRQGLAVWRPNRTGPELSGELVWASHPDGRFLLQFLKTPITLVEAQGGKAAWQVTFPPRDRTIGGRAAERLGWLHLARKLQGKRTSDGWAYAGSSEKWRLTNDATGEMIEGYLRP